MPFSASRRAVIAPPKPLPITMTSKGVGMPTARSIVVAQRRTRTSLTRTCVDGSLRSSRQPGWWNWMTWSAL